MRRLTMARIAIRILDAKTRALRALRRFVSKEEDGASAVEYGLLVALIAAIIVGTVATLGTKVLSGFTTVEGKLP